MPIQLIICFLLGAVSSVALSQTGPTNMDPVASLEVTQPRAYGYYLGDKFERVIHLSLNKPYILDEARLPKPGKMIPWLNIEAPEIDLQEQATTNDYRITLTYQIINIDREFLDIGVEGHEIGIKNSNGTEPLNLLIRPVRIRASMIANETPSVSSNTLQEDIKPAPVERKRDRSRLFVGLAIASYVIFMLLTLGLPFMKQKPAFTNAYHHCRSKGETEWSPEQYDEAFKQTHRAFNDTAGRVVFLEDLGAFFTEHSNFEGLRDQITEFYEHSRDYYFSQQHKAQSEYSPVKLIALLKNCSEVERGMA